MITAELPIFSPTFKNVDDIVLSDQAALQYNGFIDDLGGINVRPGESNGYNAPEYLGYFRGVIPTKAQVIDLIKLMIKGFSQNPIIEPEINENDVIILQGL